MNVYILIDAGDVYSSDRGVLDHIGSGSLDEQSFRKLLAYLLRCKRPRIDELLGYMERGEHILFQCSFRKEVRDAGSSKV